MDGKLNGESDTEIGIYYVERYMIPRRKFQSFQKYEYVKKKHKSHRLIPLLCWSLIFIWTYNSSIIIIPSTLYSIRIRAVHNTRRN